VAEVSASEAPTLVFRLPRPAYFVVLFIAIGITPVALYSGPAQGAPAKVSGLTLLYLLPLLAAVFIARTSTRVDATGIRIQAVFGSKRLAWTDLRGISVTGRSVYAVATDGSLRMPCVRQNDLTAIAEASGGRLPELAQPVIKAAPSRHR
jgi:hypothetical protein